MPTPQLAQQILQAVNELGQIDLKRVLRTELGELAAYDEFHAQLENLFQRIESIRNQIAEVSNQAGQNFLDALRNLTNNLREWPMPPLLTLLGIGYP